MGGNGLMDEYLELELMMGDDEDEEEGGNDSKDDSDDLAGHAEYTLPAKRQEPVRPVRRENVRRGSNAGCLLWILGIVLLMVYYMLKLW